MKIQALFQKSYRPTDRPTDIAASRVTFTRLKKMEVFETYSIGKKACLGPIEFSATLAPSVSLCVSLCVYLSLSVYLSHLHMARC